MLIVNFNRFRIKSLEFQLVCVGKKKKKIGIRHCSKLHKSKLKNVKTTGKSFIFLLSSTNQMVKLDRSKIAEKEFLQNFKKA